MSGHVKTSQGPQNTLRPQRVNGRCISGVLFGAAAHTPTSKIEGLCPAPCIKVAECMSKRLRTEGIC